MLLLRIFNIFLYYLIFSNCSYLFSLFPSPFLTISFLLLSIFCCFVFWIFKSKVASLLTHFNCVSNDQAFALWINFPFFVTVYFINSCFNLHCKLYSCKAHLSGISFPPSLSLGLLLLILQFMHHVFQEAFPDPPAWFKCSSSVLPQKLPALIIPCYN